MQNDLEIDDIFTVRTANEWMRHARERPDARKLFGDMWHEGELAVVFGDTGAGKSALAMQIAESVAGGREFEELTCEAEPQTVVYLDLELGDKQFLKRYVNDFGPERYVEDVDFSERLHRVEVNLSAALPEGCRSFEEYLVGAVERLVKAKDAKVLVVDSISVLARSSASTREGIEVLRGLNRLRREYGLSILVVAHTPKRTVTRPIVLSDMQHAKLFANFADSVFAVGHSRVETNVRYLKQIRSKQCEVIYGGEHVPVFRFSKMDGSFLGFWFETYATEIYHLTDYRDSTEWKVIESVKRMHDNGHSLREIATAKQRSKSAIHRLLHMWHATQPLEGEDFEPRSYEVEVPVVAAEPAWQPPPEAYPGERTDNYLIKIGLRPVNRERILSAAGGEFFNAEAAETAKSQPSNAADLSQEGGFTPALSTTETSGGKPAFPTASDNIADIKSEQSRLDAMKRVVDQYGTVRFVEEEYYDGKPRIWYQYRSDGKLRRWEHRLFTASDTPVDFGLVA
ncbi:MAG TPA: AAA family ATPase [Pyrinomonadaceae bacterium]|nr:AAA family ATPase [Pyrinomonadaceae bacterium]